MTHIWNNYHLSALIYLIMLILVESFRNNTCAWFREIEIFGNGPTQVLGGVTFRKLSISCRSPLAPSWPSPVSRMPNWYASEMTIQWLKRMTSIARKTKKLWQTQKSSWDRRKLRLTSKTTKELEVGPL